MDINNENQAKQIIESIKTGKKLEIKLGILDEFYDEWSGGNRLINSCRPVHDSAETIEFAEYSINKMIELSIGSIQQIVSGGEAIAEVKSAPANGCWRSIHSILPSKEDYYLVYYIDNYEEIKKAYYDAGAKRFIGMGNRVTHWMPLPEKTAVL